MRSDPHRDRGDDGSRRSRFTIHGGAGPLACVRWGSCDTSRPVALLVHGTGFCASVWDGVARELTHEFDVVAFDRRGHGASAKPADAYELTDFADDVVAITDELGLHRVYGIGHSAGGTDLLLAAPRRPGAFARLLVIEPTVMDPFDPTGDIESAPGPDPDVLERLQRRRATFPSRAAARDRLAGRGIFAGWRDDLLDAYLADGVRARHDGAVELRCTPTLEAAMMRPIAAAMNGLHGPRTFRPLADIGCPVLVATTERSNPRFKRMADTARRTIPCAEVEHLAGVGHAAPQTAPERIADLARRFWTRGTT